MAIEEDFAAAVDFVSKKDASVNISNAEKLKFYALYKQATEGDVIGKQPGFLQAVARAKYDAWAKLKNMSKQEAKQQYITAVKPFIDACNVH